MLKRCLAIAWQIYVSTCRLRLEFRVSWRGREGIFFEGKDSHGEHLDDFPAQCEKSEKLIANRLHVGWQFPRMMTIPSRTWRSPRLSGVAIVPRESHQGPQAWQACARLRQDASESAGRVFMPSDAIGAS